MSHYTDAEALLALADASALEASRSADPMDGLAQIAGAAVYILGAQVHATLALVDAHAPPKEESA